jgi:hypothetical protein
MIPESVPSLPPVAFDVAAVASVAGFRDSCGNVPLDMCVPVRTNSPIPSALGVRATFFLLHVDGVASIQKIAGMACLSLPDAIEAFSQLMVLGVVVVNDDELLASGTESGTIRVHDAHPVLCHSAA